MTLNQIVVVIIRLCGVGWLIRALDLFFETALMRGSFESAQRVPFHLAYGSPISVLALALGAWFLAEPIARLVVPPRATSATLTGLSVFDLYRFAFVLMGLYYVLASFAPLLNWLHYFLTIAPTVPENDPHRMDTVYQVTQPLITLAAGCVCLLFAPQCARKLEGIQCKLDVPMLDENPKP
jgi:hypothetical protein